MYLSRTGLRLFLLVASALYISGPAVASSVDKPFKVAQAKQIQDEKEEKARIRRLKKEEVLKRLKERQQQKRRHQERATKHPHKQNNKSPQLDRQRIKAEQRRKELVRERQRQEKRRQLQEHKRNLLIQKQVEERRKRQRLQKERVQQEKLKAIQNRRKAFEERKREQFKRSQVERKKKKPVIGQSLIERRKARKRFQNKLRNRNKADLRALRKKREILRKRVQKRYNSNLRRKQLEQAKRRLEIRRKRDRLRARNADINILRKELNRKRRQRIVGQRGRLIDFTPRGYQFRKHRYRRLGRNKYRNGLHIYLTPPVGAFIAWNLYMIDGTGSSLQEVEDVFDRPLAVDMEEIYSVNDVIEDPEIRRKVRSVNLDAITFPSGSSEITEEQLETLDNVAQAIANIIERKPRELFLIEGYTDAVGAEEFNQTLSEDRAAAVKDALIVQYGIPEQNLIDVGYGEEFLKIDTPYDEEENRRVAIRNISPLVGQRYSRRNR